LKLWERSSKKW